MSVCPLCRKNVSGNHICTSNNAQINNTPEMVVMPPSPDDFIVISPEEAREKFLERRIGEISNGSYELGKKHERRRIEDNIRDRINDLASCTKDDNCNYLADMIESYLPEWIDEEEE